MYRRLLELLNLVKPRQPHLPQTNVVRSFFRKPSKIIKIEIPKNFYNCDVTVCNNFIANSNNSADWKTLKFPLPKPLGKKWKILRYDTVNSEKTIVELISCGWF
jgi:hypothetical protein